MENWISYLNQNPQESLAIATGKAMPIGLKPFEILELIRSINKNTPNDVKKYWI